MPWDEVIYLDSYFNLTIEQRNEIAWIVRTSRQTPMASYRDEYR